jgi:hypothetical protein
MLNCLRTPRRELNKGDGLLREFLLTRAKWH